MIQIAKIEMIYQYPFYKKNYKMAELATFGQNHHKTGCKISKNPINAYKTRRCREQSTTGTIE